MPLTKAKGQIPQKDKIHKKESIIKRFRKRYSRVVCPNEAAIESNPVQKGKKHNKPQPSKAARGQNQGNGKNKHAYAPKPKIPPPPKREDPAKDSICHEYGETGHWKRNCPQYLAELLKKKKNATSGAGGGSGIFVIELNTFLNRSWIYDTGCGTHICNTTQGLRASRKLKPGALSLYVGNGQREAVEAIGNFDLSLPSGLQMKFYIYCKATKRAKIYLDSALLWHCLGHISKKRIEKLQHDGLLNSTDLRAFEKSVSCILEDAKNLHTIKWKGPKIYLTKNTPMQLVKRDTLTKPDKLEPRSIKCIFIGYPKETMGYSFYYPPENKVLVARNAEFLENSLINQEASGSLEDLEIIQEEDTHPSIDTSLNHEEDDLEMDEPQSDIIPIRRSTRTRRPTDRMCLYIDAEEHELGDLGEPANYKAALLDPESDKWLNAMNVEMQSMKDNEV
ncbi:retrotransposon protein, putative, ty1-copia subclass [Tanacetum coccineum]|uniref:Retrotransposon protein, putative, ty1-copia subclass n=1 Tax=Tanacetum coccineum TaxID=301880 RepID=A0ABQ5HB12_9ASTR